MEKITLSGSILNRGNDLLEGKSPIFTYFFLQYKKYLPVVMQLALLIRRLSKFSVTIKTRSAEKILPHLDLKLPQLKKKLPLEPWHQQLSNHVGHPQVEN